MDARRHKRDATQVFGLTKRDLKPVLRNVIGEDVRDFTVRVSRDIPGHAGYSAEKVIATFAYTTRSGHKGTVTTFVKWFHEPGPHEAHHYRELAKLHAPIPNLYAALTVAGREMIFLEYLEPVAALHPFDTFCRDREEFPKFLSAIARFNGVKPSIPYRGTLGKWNYTSRVKDVLATLDGVWDAAARGEIGKPLRDVCLRASGRLNRLKALAREIARPIARMKTGLCHNDLSPDSTCWQPETGEAVVIDLEFVSLAPRFRDAAKWLGAPDGVHPLCRPRRELALLYLEEYVGCGGSPVTLAQFNAETRYLWLADAFSTLWFSLARAIDGRVDWTDDTDEGRRAFREYLHVTLTGLLSAAR